MLQEISAEHLTQVEEVRHANDRDYILRTNRAKDLTEEQFAQALSDLRTKMAQDRTLKQDKNYKGDPWTQLSDWELGLLQRWVEEVEKTGRVRILNKDLELRTHQDAMFIDGVLGDERVVAGDIFRRETIALYQRMSSYICEMTRSHAGEFIVIPPWRAGLFAAYALKTKGSWCFAPFGASRQKNLEAEIYCAQWPKDRPRDPWVVIADLMLAGGGTTCAAIDWSIKNGINPARILVAAAVSVPEGIDRILRDFPQTLVLSASIEGGLDNRAYIRRTRLGDAGDLLWHDLSDEERNYYFLDAGILKQEHLDLIKSRMAEKSSVH